MAKDKVIKCRYCRVQEIVADRDDRVRIAICDDEPEAVSYFRRVVERSLYKLDISGKIDIYTQAKQLTDSRVDYDMIFLDIEMPDKNGLQTAMELYEQRADNKIVFITNHQEYIQEAYKVQPFRYLYKSDPEEWVKETIVDALKANDNRKGIMLDGNGHFYYILLGEILYIEALGDEILFVLSGGEKYIVRETLKGMLQILGKRFIRCRRDMLVNLKHIFRVGTETIVLDNGEEIRMSHRERKNVKNEYRDYIKEMVNY